MSDEFCLTEYGCDGISNLPASPYCHTACTLLSVSIVDGRPLDFRVEQTVDFNADYRLPCQFHCPPQPAMQIFVSQRRNRICKFIREGEQKKGQHGYVPLLDSEISLRFMNYDRSAGILPLSESVGPRTRARSSILDLIDRIGPP